VKVELALAKGRQKEDRRQAIAEKESKLEMRREAGVSAKELVLNPVAVHRVAMKTNYLFK